MIACTRAMSLQIYKVWRSTLYHIPKPYWTGDPLVGKAILGFTTKGMLGSYFFFRSASLSPRQTFTNTSLSSSLYPTNRLAQKSSSCWGYHLHDLSCSHAHKHSLLWTLRSCTHCAEYKLRQWDRANTWTRLPLCASDVETVLFLTTVIEVETGRAGLHIQADSTEQAPLVWTNYQIPLPKVLGCKAFNSHSQD